MTALDDARTWQRSCGCSHAHIARPPERSRLDITEADGVLGKAQIIPALGRVTVERSWWRRLSKDQRAAVLAHEQGHQNDPEACERCTDARAGAILRHKGYSARDAVTLLGSVVKGRETSQAALYGWLAADDAIRGAAQLRAPNELTSARVGLTTVPTPPRAFALEGRQRTTPRSPEHEAAYREAKNRVLEQRGLPPLVYPEEQWTVIAIGSLVVLAAIIVATRRRRR